MVHLEWIGFGAIAIKIMGVVIIRITKNITKTKIATDRQ